MEQPPQRTVWKFLEKLKIELSYDPAIPLLGISRENSNPKRYMHSYIHSSTIYSNQDKESAQVFTNRQMNEGNVVYIYKDEIMPITTRMDLEIIILSEVSQTEKDKYHMISHMLNLKKDDVNKLIYKAETDSQT